MAALVHQSLTNCQALSLHPRYPAAPRPGLLARWTETLNLWRRRAHERRELASFSHRDLRDIGVSSSDVWHEIRQPFWRSSLQR
jgi:uncharacterized protein YjiS (DUF1127 family)